MTDMIEAVTDAIKNSCCEDWEQSVYWCFSDADAPDVTKAAIEAARPYIIAEYNERLLSKEVVAHMGRSYSDFGFEQTTFEESYYANLGIEAAIRKAGE